MIKLEDDKFDRWLKRRWVKKKKETIKEVKKNKMLGKGKDFWKKNILLLCFFFLLVEIALSKITIMTDKVYEKRINDILWKKKRIE